MPLGKILIAQNLFFWVLITYLHGSALVKKNSVYTKLLDLVWPCEAAASLCGYLSNTIWHSAALSALYIKVAILNQRGALWVDHFSVAHSREVANLKFWRSRIIFWLSMNNVFGLLFVWHFLIASPQSLWVPYGSSPFDVFGLPPAHNTPRYPMFHFICFLSGLWPAPQAMGNVKGS